MPGDEAISWPSFTNVGPSAMKAPTSPAAAASASANARRRAVRQQPQEVARAAGHVDARPLGRANRPMTSQTSVPGRPRASRTPPGSGARAGARCGERRSPSQNGTGQPRLATRTCSSLWGVDFDDTPEEAAFRAEARAWLEANAIPKGHPDDFSAGIWTDRLHRGHLHQALPRVAGRAGRGGLGRHHVAQPSSADAAASPSSRSIFNQEQARFGVSNGVFAIAIGMVGPTLLAHGTDEQKQRYLPPMLRGDEVWCQLFSEPEAGSDLRQRRHPRRARRRRVGGHRPEGVDLGRPPRRVGDPARPHRPRRAQAPGITYFLRRHVARRASTSGRCAR